MQLTRKRIIAAAMDLIERDGVEAVSMHRLATHLGCGLMALYSYVPSTSALLDGVADVLMSGFDTLEDGARAWPEQIRAQARTFRQIAKARPRCAMLTVSRPPSSVAVLRPVERALATLCDAGFRSQDAVRVIRAIAAYVIGSVLGEIGVASGVEDDEVRRLPLRPTQFPHLTALAREPTVSDPDADFEFGLDLIVRAIQGMRLMHRATS